jgi:hypothetical protein
MSSNNWKNNIKRIENGINLSILYLPIGNNSDALKELMNV